MCGICGVIAATDAEDVGPSLERLTEALRHRGPDGRGIQFIRGRSAGLGHRRLSIVDLATGAQPMTNEDGRVWVTYNGEIYNYLALRRDLGALGHRFSTNADTEVLLHGFEAWGAGLFGRLNGIFAFALFDGRTPPGELWLVRDPVGAKPLYVGRRRGTWWFASELAAARASRLVESDLRAEAIDEFLVYRFIPSPGTPFQLAWKVPPGHLCRLSLDRLPSEPTFQRFDPQFEPAVLPRSEGEWREAVRAELAAAVRRQLMSDVPVGSLLSGGVDSTVVTRVMRDGFAEAPQAFAIGFGADEGGGELAVARRAAQALGVPLTEVAVTSEDYRRAWLDHVAQLGEPIANTGSLLVALLCRTVHATHKVILTGQGADEPLGGYPRHLSERFYPLARVLRPLLRLVPERFAASDRVVRARRIAGESDRARRFLEILAVFSPREATVLTGHVLDTECLAAPVARWLDGEPEADSVNALLRIDARLSLSDDLLITADHMAMASSVELRVPFLDLKLLALLERMPSRYKVSRLGERKWLYRRAVRPLLPDSLRGRLLGWRARTGRKLGFTTPLEGWFTQWVADDPAGFLSGRGARLPNYLQGDRLRRYVQQVAQRSLPRSRQLVTLFVLESWLRGIERS